MNPPACVPDLGYPAVMTKELHSHLEFAKRYLAALEAGATGSDLAQFYTSDVVQEEFPNRLVPNGARRDLQALQEAARRGAQIMRAQRFELLSAVESGESIALEMQWTGVLAVGLGSLEAGSEMRARFAVFLQFRDGRIWRQRNYDCFEPW